MFMHKNIQLLDENISQIFIYTYMVIGFVGEDLNLFVRSSGICMKLQAARAMRKCFLISDTNN